MSSRMGSIASESIYFTEKKRMTKKTHILLCFYRKLRKFHQAKLTEENLQFHKTSAIWSKNILITIL